MIQKQQGIKLTQFVMVKTQLALSDFVTNSYGVSWDSSCQKT